MHLPRNACLRKVHTPILPRCTYATANLLRTARNILRCARLIRVNMRCVVGAYLRGTPIPHSPDASCITAHVAAPHLSPPHHLTTSPPHHLTTAPPHHLTTSPPHHLTTSPPHHLTTHHPTSPPHTFNKVSTNH
jgi:hypothetical protein